MASKSDCICGICCETFSKKSFTTFSNLFHLQKLFDSNVIKDSADVGSTSTSNTSTCNNTSVDHVNCVEGGGKKKGAKPKLSLTSSSSPTQMSINKLNAAICPRCISCMSSTLKKKDQLTSLEVEVRQLQIKLLKLLNDLQGSINKFSEGVKKMEAIVQGSHRKVKNLDEFFEINDEDTWGKRGETVTLKDVIQLRGIMESVVGNLSEFNSQLVVKKMNGVERPKKIIKSSIIGSGATGDKINSSPPRDDSIVPGKLSSNIEAVIREDKDGRDDASFASENYQDDDDRDDDFNKEEDNLMSQLDNVHPKNENKRRRSLKQHSKHLAMETETKSDVEESANNATDDDEYLPSSSKSKKKSRKKNGSIRLPDFTGMSAFKRTAIQGLIKRNIQYPHRPNKRDTSFFDKIDPRKTHFIIYDSNTDTLKLDDIEIVIDEQEKSFKCSKCDFKCLASDREYVFLRDAIYSHIFANHLNLLSCSYCPTNLTSYKGFRNHILGHGNQFACDVCKKPLFDSFALRNHKWSHLNEEEKAEAIKNGMQPPKSYVEKTRNMEKNFQCSICGKGFIYMCFLKRHEENVHQSEKEHLCSECGKRFANKQTLADHLKHVCYPKKETTPRHVLYRFHCDKCPKKYHRLHVLNKHKALYHPIGPPALFKCSLCEKVFRTKNSRRLHEKTHSDFREFPCRKGCGGAFKTQSYRVRHEKRCGNKN